MYLFMATEEEKLTKAFKLGWFCVYIGEEWPIKHPLVVGDPAMNVQHRKKAQELNCNNVFSARGNGSLA